MTGSLVWKKAFTLLELLVVVLIIGILTAIAVPQYQKAVEKSKTASAISLLRTAYQASLEYYMANGQWPSYFDELPIQIPWTGKTTWWAPATDTRSNEDFSLQIYNFNNPSIGSGYGYGIMLGRISGKYKGGGWIIAHQFPYQIPLDTLLCNERISSGLVFDTKLPQGEYCHGIFGFVRFPVNGGGVRYYK